ncbi:MAG: AAA family ATPase [Planctomycetes bacterium]|nr:AAA family ATPase [Planctomycetota bacterium]
MIQQVTLENFKAFGARQCIPLAPLTLLYGRNSAGKSSILQSLCLLKQTNEQRDMGSPVFVTHNGRYVDLGGFHDVVHGHNTGQQVSIGLTVRAANLTHALPYYLDPHEGLGLEYTFGTRAASEDVRLERLCVYTGDHENSLVTFSPEIRDRANTRTGQPATPPRTLLGSVERRGSIDLLAELGRSFDLTKPENAVLVRFLEYWSQVETPPDLEPALARRWMGLQAEFRQFIALSRNGWQRARGTREWHDLFGKLTVDMHGLLPVKVLTQGGLPGLGFLKSIVSEVALQFESLLTSPSEMKSRVHGVLIKHLLLMMDAHDPSTGPQQWDIARLAVVAGQEVEGVLRKLVPIGPIRRPPARYYRFGGNSPTTVGYDGQHVPELLFRRTELVYAVNQWLQKLDIGYKIKVHPVGGAAGELFELRLEDKQSSVWVEAAVSDVGFGVSQVLPIVVQSLATTGQILAIEQPEVHVHPRLQAELGDLFVESAAKHGNQFILETHSEHLALRIQRRIREGSVNPEDVCVLYVERGHDGSTVTRIPLDRDGDFTDGFPGGFFTERLQELG